MGDPLLLRRASEIAKFDTPWLQELLVDMHDTMHAANGAGLAAPQIGVSVRTMHDAVQRYSGMSLHRYLRLRRLWLVRQRLLTGTPSVKACALGCGFCLLSDFSRSYRSQFGEPPSETRARARQG